MKSSNTESNEALVFEMEDRIGWEKSWVKSSNIELNEALTREFEEKIGWVKSWVMVGRKVG